MQLRYATGLSSEEYVKQKAWLDASRPRCPFHPAGGCGLARHTPYARVEPPGAFIARFYCRKAHGTVSLLPDCLASRLSSTLTEVEHVADCAAGAESREAAAEKLRPDIGTQGALRWIRRRVAGVAVALLAVMGLRPDVFAGRQPTLEDFRDALGVEAVLPRLREVAGAQLRALPPPVGFGPRPASKKTRPPRTQQGTGADPPR